MHQAYFTTTPRSFQHLTSYQHGEIQTLLEQCLPKT